MDFNAFYESIKNYVDLGTMATFIVSLFGIIGYVAKSIKDIRGTFKSTENEALKAFRAAIPKELYVNIESLAKSELEKICENINNIVNDKFLSQIKENTDLVKAIANALVTMKSIPDSQKEEIAKLLDLSEVETTEKLKVDLVTNNDENFAADSIRID